MEIKEVSVNQINLADKNILYHNQVQIDEFARSLSMFGQIRPVVVDENFEILCGNGMYLAAKQLGWEKVKVMQLSNLTDKQKKKLMIADNRIFELGTSNNEVLEEFFQELRDDLDIPGYDEETLQMVVGDMELVEEQIMEYGKLGEEVVNEIHSNKNTLEQRVSRAEQERSNAASPSVPIQPNTAPSEGRIVQTVQGENNNFVICPKCGEKIWL